MFAESIEARGDRGALILDEKKQAYLLCKFVLDYFMEQFFDSCTKGRNLLYLMFSSDPNLVISNTPLDNVIISDHTLCLIETNMSSVPIPLKERKNLYSTEIMIYNLLGASDVERKHLNEFYCGTNSDELLSHNTRDEDCDELINTLEEGVRNLSLSKQCDKPMN